jgi:hypothetical protein
MRGELVVRRGRNEKPMHLAECAWGRLAKPEKIDYHRQPDRLDILSAGLACLWDLCRILLMKVKSSYRPHRYACRMHDTATFCCEC